MRTKINITPEGLAHAPRRHSVNRYTKYAGKSKFDVGIDVAALIKQAEQEPAHRQADGSFARTVDIGHEIGVDRASGRRSSLLTVITRANGDLITAFPGQPQEARHVT